MRDLDAMVHTGLYINDLSMHDFSRDMVLAGQQQSAELKLALDQQKLQNVLWLTEFKSATRVQRSIRTEWNVVAELSNRLIRTSTK
ncbi:hypothetical protein TNCV_1188261 [Trichonephila clavipes]|nr:hypothetical protein TNCV_1188261 [Trichonephila clavipes]